MSNHDPERLSTLERRLDIAAIVAVVVTIPVTIAQSAGQSGLIIELLDWAIWSVFAIEFLILLFITPDRMQYTRRSWVNIIVVVVSFPVLHHLLALARLVRLLRLARLMRLGLVSGRAMAALRIIFGRREVVFVAALAFVIIMTGGAALALLEPDVVGGSVGNGIWWAIVTSTTVGYGDIAPSTIPGRVLGVGLMIVGVGIVATLSATVAAYFVGQDAPKPDHDLAERLDRIERNQERLIEVLSNRGRTLPDQAAPRDR